MFLFLLFSFTVHAEDLDAGKLSPIRVIGGEAQELNKPNSSHYISEEKLKKQQDTDVNRIIKQVPGVYVREEDGYGLRPNISLRGTNPDRSKKVNFMEDGILSGPAPYSAPAAYYTPSMMHVENIEVFKGVSTVIFGPNSVGGTINFLTPEIRSGGFLDGSLGSFDYRKILGRAGHAGEIHSVMFQGAYHETTGFKELPGGGDTGFKQSDFLVKTRTRMRGGDRPQYLELKAGQAFEDSNETYLGLAQRDLERDPYQRYAASARDEMKWHHQSYQANYTAALTASSSLMVSAYHQIFERNWNRLDRFAGGATLRDVLDDPDANLDQYRILRGEEDSTALGAGNGNLDIARNKRNFYSQGVQIHHLLSLPNHEIHWGFRLHEDQIRHNHNLNRFAMTGGRLVRTGDPTVAASRDRLTSVSKALFAQDDMSYGRWRFTAAARFERVDNEAREFVTNDVYVNKTVKNADQFFVPGLGALYSLTPEASLFTGVNKGYAPTGPGQSDGVKPEESTNYELGFRYLKQFFFETIGFYNDYRNIKGICSFSAGCAASSENEEFNGGKAIIYGAESRVRFDAFYSGFKFPFELNYTYTKAQFDSEFQSGSPEWGVGLIKKGSPLPYVPENQYTFSTGVAKGKIGADVRFNWTGRQFDQSAETKRRTVDGYGVVDLNVKYATTKDSFAYFKVDNLLDNEYGVAYRPYGARPGKDRTLLIGYRQSF